MNLWGVLRYDEVALGIAEALQESQDIALLEGPPGVGKSWLAKEIGGLWEAGGGSAVVAEGDLLKSDVSYFPLGMAMGGLPSAWRSVGPAIAGIAKAGETLIGTAGILTATIEALAKARRNRRRSPSMLLTDIERDILHELQRLARKRPVLLIADNLHWWDAQSLELLSRFQDPRLVSAFPFLTDLRILAVQTTEPYQSIANPRAHDALLEPRTTRCFKLGRIAREGFGEVLVALGSPEELSQEVIDAVYSLSGGHLALAKRCAVRLAQGEEELFIGAADSEEFLQRLLTERVKSLGSVGAEAVQMLQVAAVMGLTFRRDEVACVTDADGFETSRLLRYCRDEDLLELSDDLGRFVHDFYRQHFLSLGAVGKTGIHEKLSDCLRLLRPGEYDLRCINAINAERPREAAALGALAAMQTEREGRDREQLPAAILKIIEEGGLDAALEGMIAAHRHLTHYRFVDCLTSLDSLPRDLPKSLLAESDYIRAMSLMSTRSEEDRASGRGTLEAWSGYENEEPELGVRIMQLLLYAYTHLEDKEQGWALEGRIRQLLIDRTAFDLAAKDALYTLDRCAGGLYQADVALVRNREAVRHFGPDDEEAVIRRPVEFYRCLVNLGASLTGTAQYEEARQAGENVERLIEQFPAGSFPRTDYPRMNRVLSEYRGGRLTPAEACQRQQQIASEATDADPFYGENALAVYLTLDGNSEAALEIFELLEMKLARRSAPEPSMTYLIRSNMACARFQIDPKAALAEWIDLSDLVTQISYPSRPIYIRRHALLEEVIAEGKPSGAVALDEVLLARFPDEFGPLWKSFGRGFTIPAIEFWREN